jgi:hypothetical protein
MNKFKAGVIAGALMVSALAAAADVPPVLEACTALRHNSERLACYDRAIAQIKSGANGGPRLSAENMFGASGDIAPTQAAGPEPKREELRQITAAVRSVHRGKEGLLVLDLDSGQSWRQEDDEVTLFIDAGDSVIVQRAAFGTFRITDKRGRSARFKRVR